MPQFQTQHTLCRALEVKIGGRFVVSAEWPCECQSKCLPPWENILCNELQKRGVAFSNAHVMFKSVALFK